MTFDLNTYNPFTIKTEEEFNELALKIFHFQYKNNAIYNTFVDNCGRKTPLHYSEIPFLPIQFFKTHKVIAAQKPFDATFKSSGTTGTNSTHLVKDATIYNRSFIKGIQQTSLNIDTRVIIALLPNYIEQENSSLVYMVDVLIKQSKFTESGFYLDSIDKLVATLKKLEAKQQPVLLIGVSFALLDVVEKYHLKLKYTIIMETGGMKGRRKELIRAELHQKLKHGFGVSTIYSEYGMTELLSQAYSIGDGFFSCPPWMKVLTRDINDPFQLLATNRTGGINIIDLANIYSCSFIATQDLGKNKENNLFEVLGRFNSSDIRGCNLMLE